jgi:hypothetical protein
VPRPIDSATCPVAYERYERMPVGLHASHGSAAQHSQGDAATPEISWVFPLRPSFSQGQSNGPTLQHPLASAARTDALEGRLKGPLETPGMARSKIKIYKRAKSRAKSFLPLLSYQPISRNFSRFITPRSGVQVSPEPLVCFFGRHLLCETVPIEPSPGLAALHTSPIFAVDCTTTVAASTVTSRNSKPVDPELRSHPRG